MSNEALCHTPITELAARIGDRTLSPVTLTETYLERIEALDHTLNAYIEVTAQAALDAAHTAKRDIDRSGPRTPLHGIPLAHKDIVDIADIATTCGSQVLLENRAERDATVIERLTRAGAISLGKLNMNEFATILPSEHFGPALNPWDPSYSPGGSSSGSGVAVAAGLCAGALGTDTGGSIRLPAAYCGITGFKATHGRVSNRGVFPLAWSLDHIGPMTRTAEDAALIYDVIAGYDPEDLVSRDHAFYPLAQEPMPTRLDGWRLATPSTGFADMTDPQVADALAAAIEVFERLGASVERIDLSMIEDAWSIAEPIIRAEAAAVHEHTLASVPQHYGAKVRKFLQRATELSAADYVRARGARVALRRELLAKLAPYRALLMPGALTPPPALGARAISVAGRDIPLVPAAVGATCSFNLTGQPALTLACGRTASGLPCALQIVAPRWDEATALALGRVYQGQTEWHRHHPPLTPSVETSS